MQLKEYVKSLAILAEKYPNATVVYSTDDEKKRFSIVGFTPSAGTFVEGEFRYTGNEAEKNYVCIN